MSCFRIIFWPFQAFFKFYFAIMKLLGAKLASIALSRGLMFLYCMADSKTPVGTKLCILLSLGYLFSPLDIIPDVIPLFGLADDVGVLVWTKKVANMYISFMHKDRAYNTMVSWFGEDFARKSNLLSF